MAEAQKRLRQVRCSPLKKLLGFLELQKVDVHDGVERTVEDIAKGKAAAFEGADGILGYRHQVEHFGHPEDGLDLIEKQVCLVVGLKLVEFVDADDDAAVLDGDQLQKLAEVL